MEGKHFALLAGSLAAIGAMVGSLHGWSEALSPLFIGGVIGVVGTQLGAIYTEKPVKKADEVVQP